MELDSRNTALKILLGCQKKKSTLDKSIDDSQKELAVMSQQDRNLCNAIVFGVLRQQGYLDFIIKSFLKKPFEKLDIKALHILRIALFQIIFLDRIPSFAAINTSIELAKRHGNKNTAGFINAVLRNACESYQTITLPDKNKNIAAHISVTYSMPGWLTKKWLASYGPEKTISLCQSITTIPPITLRTNTLKTDRETLGTHLKTLGLSVENTKKSPAGLNIFKSGMPVSEIKGFDQGLFQIQDEAAQLVSQILDPQPGETILDACAGLGGKTCHIAQLMENKGMVIAADSDSGKLDNLRAETLRLGINNTQTRQVNLLETSIKDFQGYFDRVLLDAPCTGLGVIRRNPDIKWKRKLADIIRLCAQQKKMLNSAANLVKPGGILVFAVCSCEPEENEQVIEAFLKKRKDYSLDSDFDSDFDSEMDADRIQLSSDSRLMTANLFFKTYPSALYMDGFFAARLKRAEKKT